MPFFNYHCEKCDLTEERMVKKYDDVVKCTKCGGDVVKQVSSPKGFILKGAGFYRNDSIVNEMHDLKKKSDALLKKGR